MRQNPGSGLLFYLCDIIKVEPGEPDDQLILTRHFTITMTNIFVVVLSALAVTIVSAQSDVWLGSTCKPNQDEIQKTVMECVSHEPLLLFQVIEHIKNPESMATTNFICQNQKEVVNLLMCLEDKYVSCFGSIKEHAMQYLPNHDRWEDAVKFMCDHKTDLIETNCMDQNQLQEIMQCYMGKLVSIFQSFQNSDEKTAVCSVIHSEEQCIQTYHGACTQTYVSLLIKFVDKLFPFCPEMTIDVKNQALSDAVGSILVRGQPLKFQPHQNVRYNVV